MFPYLILGIALLVGLLLLARWFVNADPKQVVGALRISAAIVLGAGGLYLLLSGRIAYALGFLLMAVPFLMRLMQLKAIFNRLKSAAGPTPGQSSVVETEFIRMTLEHDTGEMDGEVLKGAFTGRRLSDMALDDLIALLEECSAADQQSSAVLAAYLDRAHGDEWRDRAGGARTADEAFGGDSMTREQAFQILGLKPGASDDAIKEAHRRLMKVNHPDHGGSTFIAAKINQAKEVLLGES